MKLLQVRALCTLFEPNKVMQSINLELPTFFQKLSLIEILFSTKYTVTQHYVCEIDIKNNISSLLRT